MKCRVRTRCLCGHSVKTAHMEREVAAAPPRRTRCPQVHSAMVSGPRLGLELAARKIAAQGGTGYQSAVRCREQEPGSDEWGERRSRRASKRVRRGAIA